MRIIDLGLRPSLQEDVPPSVQAKQDLKMINQIDQRIQQNKKAKRRRKRLNAVLAKVDAAVQGNTSTNNQT